MLDIHIISRNRKQGEEFLKKTTEFLNTLCVINLTYPDFSNPKIFSHFIRIFYQDQKLRIKLKPINIKVKICLECDNLEDFRILFSDINEGLILIDTTKKDILDKIKEEYKKSGKNNEIYFFKANTIKEKTLILIYFISEIFKILPSQNILEPENFKEKFLIQKL
ncbi:MAG: hypothetical protein ABIN23_00555 [candidate division WOR-3 bacterium]